jgi:hypothetical protein
LATKLTTPALTLSVLALPVANPRFPAVNDGRSYNQHLYTGQGAYQVNNAVTNLAVTGAYHRIHAVHSLAPLDDPGGAPTCQRVDASDQIGCLVTASPCSLGVAGRQALVTNANAAAIKINRQSPLSICLEGRFSYPLARKLYLNSVLGFAALTGEELQLAGCMTDLAQPSHVPPTPDGLLTTNLVAAGFIHIPALVNGGRPFCEDFNEATLCGAPTNVDACGQPKANFDHFPAFETVCGDGRVDAFEDCDNGMDNGAAPATCSTSCRFHN